MSSVVVEKFFYQYLRLFQWFWIGGWRDICYVSEIAWWYWGAWLSVGKSWGLESRALHILKASTTQALDHCKPLGSEKASYSYRVIYHPDYYVISRLKVTGSSTYIPGRCTTRTKNAVGKVALKTQDVTPYTAAWYIYIIYATIVLFTSRYSRGINVNLL